MLFMQSSHTSDSLKASLICSKIPCNAGGNANVRLQHSDVQITGAPGERLKPSRTPASSSSGFEVGLSHTSFAKVSTSS